LQSNAIAIFPYLKTSGPVTYKNLTIRSASAIPESDTKEEGQIKEIRDMFFLRDNYRIRDISYTTVPLIDGEISPGFATTLRQFRTLASFLYSSPHPTFGDTFLSDDHANLFVFIPKQISMHLLVDDRLCDLDGESVYPVPDTVSNVPGYEVSQNFITHFWVTNGSRIYPPTRSFWLNLSQDLFHDILNSDSSSHSPSVYEIFNRSLISSTLEMRIYTALTWYNRANSLDVQEEVALINLAVAFESLLSLEQGPELTKRFRQTVYILLGGVPRLDVWLTQFYNARSKIVHKGRVDDFRFVAVDSPKKIRGSAKKYRSLVSDGRDIFRLCLRTLLFGSIMAKESNLSSRLFTNQERLEQICRVMSQSDQSGIDKFETARPLVREASEYRFVEETGLELKTLIGAVRLASKVFVESGFFAPPDMRQLLSDFIESPSDDDFLGALSVICQIHNEYSDTSRFEIDDSEEEDRLSTLILLFNVVWMYSFTYYYWVRDRAKSSSMSETGRASRTDGK